MDELEKIIKDTLDKYEYWEQGAEYHSKILAIAIREAGFHRHEHFCYAPMKPMPEHPEYPTVTSPMPNNTTCPTPKRKRIEPHEHTYLTPLGTTGKFTDSMGNVYSRE